MSIELTYEQLRALRAVDARAPYADTIALTSRRQAIAELVALGLVVPSYPVTSGTYWPRKFDPLTRLGRSLLEERSGSVVGKVTYTES